MMHRKFSLIRKTAGSRMMRRVKVAAASIDEPIKSSRTGKMIRNAFREVTSDHGGQTSSIEKDVQYTKEELSEFRALFSMLDTDGSGALGNDELKQAVQRLGLQIRSEEIDDLIKEVDADGNGEIDFEEFCICMKKSQTLASAKTSNEEVIRQCFEVFDQDRNGLISENEFKFIAKEIGGYSDLLAEYVFSQLDISGAGTITADQFGTIVEDYLLNEDSRQESPSSYIP
ncbi:hypothetical protein QR680_019243 [Steinernema hermaphroditum]|uniref:EF-hand domain-containing protein n=1 Tax=Steinernema hermaphroditum TaxID=289476 RepID=A0AA39HKF7_9BILA|nr:hypothetical protein QR680_019243 [Steinernema hermaphroditum]